MKKLVIVLICLAFLTGCTSTSQNLANTNNQEWTLEDSPWVYTDNAYSKDFIDGYDIFDIALEIACVTSGHYYYSGPHHYDPANVTTVATFRKDHPFAWLGLICGIAVAVK